jgi:hypothetical protein
MECGSGHGSVRRKAARITKSNSINMAPWIPPDGLFNDDYNDDFVKLDKPDKMKIPFKSTDATKPQWKMFLLWLLLFTALFLATMLLDGCATVKYKSPCNVIAIGYGTKK